MIAPGDPTVPGAQGACAAGRARTARARAVDRATRHARRRRHRGPPAAAGRRAICALSRRPRPAPAGGARASRHRTALQPSGRGARARRRRPQHRRHHADGVGQDALLQPAGARRDPARSRRPARSTCFRPRRWRRIRWRSCTSWPGSWATPAPTPIGVHTYDGDTPADARRTIRTRAHVVLSNPDMLHSGILPHHPRWAKLFENLRYIVIDELHAYRGVFGSHLCNVLRRLRRIARHYGSDPQIHLLVGDDRQSTRAGRAARRAAVRARVGERRAARREVLRLRQPAGRQSRARHPPLVPRRNAARRRRVPAPQPAGDRLCAEPAVDRDSDDLSEGGLRGRAGHAGDDSRLSRRLSAAAPPRDRARLARRARCAASSRPTRSSSASTSARSMSRCSPAIRARSPRRGSAPAAPAAARRDRRRCWSRRARRSISSSSAIRRISSTRRPSTR